MADQDRSEQWRPVVGYEKWYEVSDLGRVRRVPGPWAVNKAGKFLRAAIKNGYYIVGMSANCKIKTHSVHRLVLTAFVGPCPAGHQCDHIDGNRLNNAIDNLRWVTAKQNMQAMHDRVDVGRFRRGVHESPRKLTGTMVEEIRRAHDSGESNASMAKRFGVSKGHIGRIINGHAHGPRKVRLPTHPSVTATTIVQLRNEYDSGVKHGWIKQTADQLGVDECVVSSIIHRRTYANVG